MLKLDGKTLVYDRAFSHNNINYPRNWLRLTSLSEKQAIGITEVADPVTPSYNQKFYWGVGNPKVLEDTNNYASYDEDGKGEGDVTSVTTGLKTLWIAKQKKNAAALLSPTDWLVTRYAEATTVIPVKTKDYRASVRTVCGEREAQITACADTDELCALITGTLPKTVNGDEKKDEDDKSFDPKQFEQVANPALLKDWPTE